MRTRVWAPLVLIAAAAAIAGSCGGVEEAPAAPTASPAAQAPVGSDVAANVFRNGGFEAGPNPWFSFENPSWGTPFRVSTEQAHSGSSSALLELRADPATVGSMVFGVIQEVEAPEFPQVLSGYYYVADWVRDTPKQYLQFVVIALEPDNLPGGYTNYQIRYPLAGIADDPFAIDNAKFLFVSKDEPATGRWVYFERPIRQDFLELWGAVPSGYDKIRVLFEVRFDDKAAGEVPSADVLYDDLYVGPAADNPNSP